MVEIIIPGRISREFIRAHTQCNFVYGADHSLKGFFGQMNAAHNEPNAYPVSTMLKICQSSTDKFYYDQGFDFFKKLIDDRIEMIPTDKPVIPFQKIGMGYSNMINCAPKLYSYLMERLAAIKYPLITVDWNGQVYTQ